MTTYNVGPANAEGRPSWSTPIGESKRPALVDFLVPACPAPAHIKRLVILTICVAGATLSATRNDGSSGVLYNLNGAANGRYWSPATADHSSRRQSPSRQLLT